MPWEWDKSRQGDVDPNACINLETCLRLYRDLYKAPLGRLTFLAEPNSEVPPFNHDKTTLYEYDFVSPTYQEELDALHDPWELSGCVNHIGDLDLCHWVR